MRFRLAVPIGLLLVSWLGMPAALSAQRPAGVARTAAGYTIDFDDQDVRTVLAALAEAAGASITFSNIPDSRTTLHFGQPVSKAQLFDVMRTVADQNDLTLVIRDSLVQVERARQVERVGPRWPRSATPEVSFYTYRLKYADAATIAPLLTTLFAGQDLDGPEPEGPESDGRRGRRGRRDWRRDANPTDGTSQLRVVAEESTNTLLIRATPEEWAWVQRILRGKDSP